MQKTNRLVATWLLLAALFVASCTEKDYYDPNYTTPNPLEDITAPDDFDWKMTLSADVSVSVKDAFNGQYHYLIEIFDQNPVITSDAKLITQGFAKEGQSFDTKITVPNTVENVFIRQTAPDGLSSVRMASMESGKIDLDFGSTGKVTRSLAAGTRAETRISVDPNDETIFPTEVPDGVTTVLTGEAGRGDYIINSNTTLIKITGEPESQVSKLYVVEDATVKYENTKNVYIYILPGKKLTFTNSDEVANSSTNALFSVGKDAEMVISNFKPANDAKIYNNGTITISNKFHLVGTTIFYNLKGLSVADELWVDFNTVFVNDGDIDCKKFTAKSHANITNNATVKVSGLSDFQGGNTQWTNNGLWETENMNTISSGDTFINNCKLLVKNKLDIRTARPFYNNSYIETLNLYLHTSRIQMGSESFFNVTGEADFYSNSKTNKYGFQGAGEKRSVLKMNKATGTGWAFVYYYGSITIICSDHYLPSEGWTKTMFEEGAEWASESTNPIKIDESACNPGINTNPNPPTEPEPGPDPDPYTYTYLFEDNWPVYGDYDMNDVVFTINEIVKNKNNENKVEDITFKVTLQALGANKAIATALMLDEIEASQVNSVTYTDGTAPVAFSTSLSGAEIHQTRAVIPLMDNVHTFIGKMNAVNGTFVNTEIGSPNNVSPTPSLTVKITFTAPVSSEKVAVESFNPFIMTDINTYKIKNNNRKEIHVIGYAPTDRATTEFFDNHNDRSIAKRYYATDENLAWGIMAPISFKWPKEYMNIKNAYSGFAEWVSSGGDYNKDWWKSPDENSIFHF